MRPLRLGSCFVRGALLRGALFGALASAALAAASPALADAGSPGAASAIVLKSSACFDRAQLGAEIDRYLDHPLHPSSVVIVTDSADRLAIESASGAVEKDVSGWSCRQRLEFAAVSASIILGGDYTPRAVEAPFAAPPDAAAAPVPPPVIPRALVPVIPALPPPRRPTVEIGAEGGAVFELLPRPAAGFMITADRTLVGPFDLHAALLVTSAVAVPFQAVRAEASLLVGLVEGCVSRGEGLRLRLCAGLAAGRLGVSWAGLSPASTPSPWSAGAGRFDAQYEVSRQVSFAVSLDMFVPIGQQRIDLVEPGLCPAGVPAAAVPACNALAPFSGGHVVETSSLSGSGMMLSVGPMLRFW